MVLYNKCNHNMVKQHRDRQKFLIFNNMMLNNLFKISSSKSIFKNTIIYTLNILATTICTSPITTKIPNTGSEISISN